MLSLIQRVTSASVTVDDAVVGAIGPGLLALVAVEPGDTDALIQRMAERLLGYRVFEDASGRMNRSLADIGGGLLLVSQFTLAADTRSGMRASFTTAAPPDDARRGFDRLVEVCRHQDAHRKGKEQGYLTYAEVNDHLPDDIVDPEQIEDIIGMINDMGIEVHEDRARCRDPAAERQAAATEVDETAAEEAAAALAPWIPKAGRTTDPVRMYMREMGTVELLTREGEIAIAKRIEEGLRAGEAALASFPWSVSQLLLEEYDVARGKKRLSRHRAGFFRRR
jgi:D-tyrosyl-tRNA(Tyr) deacylase